MRILPLALWHAGPDADLARMAMEHSALTHAHPLCRVACATYCLWARGLIEDRTDPFEAAIRQVAGFVRDDLALAAALDQINEHRNRPPTGTGYVVDTLFSARHVLEVGVDY